MFFHIYSQPLAGGFESITQVVSLSELFLEWEYLKQLPWESTG